MTKASEFIPGKSHLLNDRSFGSTYIFKNEPLPMLAFFQQYYLINAALVLSIYNNHVV